MVLREKENMKKKTIITTAVCLFLAFAVLILDIISELQTKKALQRIDKACEEISSLNIDYEMEESLNTYLFMLPKDLRENEDIIRDAWINGFNCGISNRIRQ